MRNYILITLMLILVSCASENSDWENTLTENSIDAYNTFIEKYPDGQFTSIACDSLISVEYKEIIKENTVKSYENFLLKYPNSKFSSEMNDSLEYFAGNIIWKNSTNGYFLDIRDKQKYNVIKIGKQIWMAENLRFKTSNTTYYQYDEKEYDKLINYLGGSSVAGKKLKNAYAWKKDRNGINYVNNQSGFNALPGGSLIVVIII